jgi:hypothetical protein
MLSRELPGSSSLLLEAKFIDLDWDNLLLDVALADAGEFDSCFAVVIAVV